MGAIYVYVGHTMPRSLRYAAAICVAACADNCHAHMQRTSSAWRSDRGRIQNGRKSHSRQSTMV
jgi:hypothetical protein